MRNLIIGSNLINKRKQLNMDILVPAGTYVDDFNYNLGDIGFDFPFYDTTHRSAIFVGSNSYITFGFGSNNYNSLSASNPGKGILIAAADNGIIGGLYTRKDNPGTSFRIRFEGTNRSTNYPKNIIWETTLYSNGNIKIITETIEQKAGAVSMITKGDGSSYQTSFTIGSNETRNFYSAYPSNYYE